MIIDEFSLGEPINHGGAPFRVLLLSTYDLGRQPFGLASPAAWLNEEAEVACQDLAVEPMNEVAVQAAQLVAFLKAFSDQRSASKRLSPGA